MSWWAYRLLSRWIDELIGRLVGGLDRRRGDPTSLLMCPWLPPACQVHVVCTLDDGRPIDAIPS
jgi:hypothetical protein